jgi:uncharacterized protein YaiI (UPF0178 family)
MIGDVVVSSNIKAPDDVIAKRAEEIGDVVVSSNITTPDDVIAKRAEDLEREMSEYWERKRQYREDAIKSKDKLL